MRKLVIFSGAGLSADSGVPTFRDADGLWQGHSIDDVCHFGTWRKNYQLVHHFYNGLRKSLATVIPNAAHQMIAGWQKDFRTVNLTQNVDDLLERAGCPQVIHLHGELTKMQCLLCDSVWEIGYGEWQHDHACTCGDATWVKPFVVFFGEAAPNYEVMWNTFADLCPNDVVVVIGTSSQVIDISSILSALPGYKFLVNLQSVWNQESDKNVFDSVHYGRAAEMAPMIDQLVRKKMTEPT
jgi:NAD-dependent deacetylase